MVLFRIQRKKMFSFTFTGFSNYTEWDCNRIQEEKLYELIVRSEKENEKKSAVISPAQIQSINMFGLVLKRCNNL